MDSQLFPCTLCIVVVSKLQHGKHNLSGSEYTREGSSHLPPGDLYLDCIREPIEARRRWRRFRAQSERRSTVNKGATFQFKVALPTHGEIVHMLLFHTVCSVTRHEDGLHIFIIL